MPSLTWQYFYRMEIICNNCNKDISFQDNQNFVVCPYCYTHLEISENDKTIAVKIIQPSENDDSKSFTLTKILFKLKHLEYCYSLYFTEKRFRAVFMNSRFRPTLVYSWIKLVMGISVLWISLSDLANIENIFYFAIKLAGVIYGIFLIIWGYKELSQWVLMGRFEQKYFEEKDELIDEIERINLSDNIHQQFEKYKRIHNEYHSTQTANYHTKMNTYIYNLTTKTIGEVAFIFLVILFIGNGLLSSRFGDINMFITNIVIICSIILGFRLFQKHKKSNMVIDEYQNHNNLFIKQLEDYLS